MCTKSAGTVDYRDLKSKFTSTYIANNGYGLPLEREAERCLRAKMRSRNC
jgi:hypothetical protein